LALRLVMAVVLLVGLSSAAHATVGADQPAHAPDSAGSRAEVSALRSHGKAAAHKIDARAHRLATAVADDIQRVEPYLERYGYWAVFAAVGIEGIGIPAPGQTLLEAGAIVAAVPNSSLNVGLLLLVTIVATVLGQAIGYLIGRYGGRVILHRLPIPAPRIDAIERGFNRYGGWLIVFGRFVDGPRQLTGLVAGALEMHWARFMLLTIAGAVLWASFWTLGVYYLDLHFDTLVAAIRHLNPWMAGLTVIAIVALLLFALIAVLKQRRKASP